MPHALELLGCRQATSTDHRQATKAAAAQQLAHNHHHHLLSRSALTDGVAEAAHEQASGQGEPDEGTEDGELGLASE